MSQRTRPFRPPSSSHSAVAIVAAALLLGTTEANAGDDTIAVGEVSSPTESSKDVAAVRDVAEGEIRQIDRSQLPDRRHVVVSFALSHIGAGPVVCNVNALVRDAKTGAMIAIIEAGARAEGSSSPEIKKQVTHAAVRNAVRRIPRALGGK